MSRDRPFSWASHATVYSDHPCPKCGGRVEVEGDCPGYGRGADGYAAWVCGGPCGNAVLYECEDDEGCGWWWREPNNRGPKNWRDVEMGPKPDWPVGWQDDDDEDVAI